MFCHAVALIVYQRTCFHISCGSTIFGQVSLRIIILTPLVGLSPFSQYRILSNVASIITSIITLSGDRERCEKTGFQINMPALQYDWYGHT